MRGLCANCSKEEGGWGDGCVGVSGGRWVSERLELVSCPAHAHLPARNSLVNEVKFLGLITQNG